MNIRNIINILKQREYMTGIIVALVIVGLFVIVPLLEKIPDFPPPIPPSISISPEPPPRLPEDKMPTFKSCSELETKLKEAQQSSRDIQLGNINDGMEKSTTSADGMAQLPMPGGGGEPDYSKTNVQVEGVDEADIVKTDGKYIYALSQGKIYIVKAGEPMEKVATISFGSDTHPQDMYVENNSLIVFGGTYNSRPWILPSLYNSNLTFVNIYDISQKERPVLKRSLGFDANYQTSRLIQGYVYMVLGKGAYIEDDAIEKTLPQYIDNTIAVEGGEDLKPLVKCTDISYADPILDSQYLIIVSFPTNPQSRELKSEVVLGAGETFYASHYNLYTAGTRYSGGLFRIGNIGSVTEKTKIHKFNLIGGDITHVAEGEVEGRLLNQFSMDEHNNYFRLATTIGHVSQRGDETDNRVYVLDSKLKKTGEITGIAPGEQIYSARFMGSRGYLVTFKKVDPFFTLDLSNPASPKVAGQLKIPGFSDYLHPYDDTHIIGIGKETIEAEGGNFAWYQGLKMAIFDVTDFNNPQELHRIIIGDRGSDSPVLFDHKAFLFSKDRNLLVLPANIAEISAAEKQQDQSRSPSYGTTTFQGALVYNITLDKGFEELKRITHDLQGYPTPHFVEHNSSMYYPPSEDVSRSLYIGNTLYTISESIIQAHRMGDYSKVGEIYLTASDIIMPQVEVWE